MRFMSKTGLRSQARLAALRNYLSGLGLIERHSCKHGIVRLLYTHMIKPINATPTLFVHPTEQELKSAMRLAA
jgi:hypothetical protein